MNAKFHISSVERNGGNAFFSVESREWQIVHDWEKLTEPETVFGKTSKFGFLKSNLFDFKNIVNEIN